MGLQKYHFYATKCLEVQLLNIEHIKKGGEAMVERIINIPNIITSIGILGVFVYAAGYLSGNASLALAALIAVVASDIFDEFLARLLCQETFIGLLLDKARGVLLFLTIAGNLWWIGTPGTIFLLKVVVILEIVWATITFATPASSLPHKSADHLFNKIRQCAYLLIIAFVIISR